VCPVSDSCLSSRAVFCAGGPSGTLSIRLCLGGHEWRCLVRGPDACCPVVMLPVAFNSLSTLRSGDMCASHGSKLPVEDPFALKWCGQNHLRAMCSPESRYCHGTIFPGVAADCMPELPCRSRRTHVCLWVNEGMIVLVVRVCGLVSTNVLQVAAAAHLTKPWPAASQYCSPTHKHGREMISFGDDSHHEGDPQHACILPRRCRRGVVGGGPASLGCLYIGRQTSDFHLVAPTAWVV
jgi:hypothetical protein